MVKQILPLCNTRVCRVQRFVSQGHSSSEGPLLWVCTSLLSSHCISAHSTNIQHTTTEPRLEGSAAQLE